jgi:hypothetical protein
VGRRHGGRNLRPALKVKESGRGESLSPKKGEKKMAEINFGKVFGTLINEEDRCQIDELTSSLVCENPATQTLAINPDGWNGYEYAYHTEIQICEDCWNQIH